MVIGSFNFHKTIKISKIRHNTTTKIKNHQTIKT